MNTKLERLLELVSKHGNLNYKPEHCEVCGEIISLIKEIEYSQRLEKSVKARIKKAKTFNNKIPLTLSHFNQKESIIQLEFQSLLEKLS